MRRFLAAPALSTGLALALALGSAPPVAAEVAAAVPAQPARPSAPVAPARVAAPVSPAPPAPAEESASGPTSTRLPGLAARPAPATEFPRPPAEPAARRAWLKTVLDETFAVPPLARAKVGVLVVEADTGKPLYARGDKTALNAASNVKIVTSASALALLGPDYRWKTTISIPANGKGSSGAELAGDLYLRGFGDPTLTTEDLASLAGDLWAEGIRRVKGTIVADETFFDGTHVGPAYEQKSDSTASRAPSAALSLNGNLISVTIVPASKAGGLAKVLVDPPSAAFVVQGRIITTSSGPAPATVETSETEGGRTQITVSGRVRAGAEPRVYRRRVTNPPLYAAFTLKALMERRGITIAQPPHLGVAPAGSKVLATNDSQPLGVVVHDLNKRSNNFTAEQVLRTMGAEIIGRPGTWEKGLDAVGRYLATLGIRKGSYQMMNGSGLYDSNRFTPEQMVTILRGAMRDFRISAEFMASLSIAGTDGTIGHRMGGTPAERFVRAKTGTLATASCLSGFAGSPGHAPLIFSILMNDLAGASDARLAQDRAAELLVAYIEADNLK